MKKFFKALLIILMVLAYLFTMVVAIGLPLIEKAFENGLNRSKTVVEIPGVDDGWLVVSRFFFLFGGEATLYWLTEKNELLEIGTSFSPGIIVDHVVNNGDGTFTAVWGYDHDDPCDYSYTFRKPAEIGG